MPRLNENILAFDSIQSVTELLKAIRTASPSYVVLRVKKEYPQAAEFFVFPTKDVRALLAKVSLLKRRNSLASVLPQLSSEAAAPELSAGHEIYSWNEVYESGPWPGAFQPVSTSYGHAIGVWEADPHDAPIVRAEPDLVQDIEEEEDFVMPETSGFPEDLNFPEDLSSPEDLNSPEELSSPEDLNSPEEPSLPEDLNSPEELSSQEALNSPEEPSLPEGSNFPEEPGFPEDLSFPEESSPSGDSSDSLESSELSDYDMPFPLPASPPARSRISTLKDSVSHFFRSDTKKSSSRPDLIDFSEFEGEMETIEEIIGETIEEAFPEEALTEYETEIAIDEVDSLLQHHTLFPNIEASNLHPVIEEQVHVTVSLQAEQVREITGMVSFPDAGEEDYVYQIRVHILCGDESQWEVLEYSQGDGMLKNAEFGLTMPDMPLDLSGNYPERHKLPLRVNFYFQNRWCGEGERYLDLRLEASVKPLNRIPPPPQSEWRKLIKLEPISEPPDLLVRIAHKPGTTAYHWSCLSPHLEFGQIDDDAVMVLPGSTQAFVNNLFEPFATIELNDHQSTTLKGICEEIYDSAPAIFKRAFWQLTEASKTAPFEFNSILFISDESYIPWELMRITDPRLQADAGILATTHSVGRWLAGSSNYLTQQISIDRFAVSGSDYVDQRLIPDLPWVAKELDQLSTRYQAESVPLTSDAVLNFLQNGNAQAMHFACHGSMSVKTPYKSELIMEDHPQSITPPNVSSYEVEIGLGAQHPLIFLNACQSGATANGLSLVSGFPAAFLKAGAAAVICPLWTVNDEQANIISQLFYEAAFEQPGITLGEIMRSIHQRWESEQQLTYLSYVLYGDPQTRIEFLPEIQG